MKIRLLILLIAGIVVTGQGTNTSKVLLPHPSWNCGMPDGIPNPESGTLILEVQMKLERVANIGKTPFGNR